MIKRRALIASVAALGLGFSGCTPPTPSGLADNQVANTEVSLGNSVAAFYLSRQSAGFTGKAGDGFVGLIDPKGNVSALRTSGMDNGQLDWDETGIVFADTENDYHLADTLTKTKSPKTNYQQAIFSTGDGGSVGLYNDGFTEEGYVEQLVTTASGKAQMNEIEGNYSVTGMCDGGIVGTAEPSGPYARQAEAAGYTLMGEYELQSQMLAQLGAEAGNKEQVISIQAIDEGSQFSSDAPCANGRLYHLASLVPDGDTRSLALRVWDIDSGDFEQHALTLPDGTEPLLVNDLGFEIDGYDRASLRGDRFDWVAIDGRVMSTDTSDGTTTELFTLEADGYDSENPVRAVEFTDTTLGVLTVDIEAQMAHFVAYDRENGKETVRLKVEGIAEALEAGLVLRDMSVAPK
ncbi:hypothetical protein [Brevibacterium otitidis]|uniref:Uncharacterized protein n=1 Tax=Brevibacterium otitidis TaxID=53364 RepID=A0ABV5X1S5_9MICO|nr:hypothetical protein GCM10023233_30920 [Brevibacterium otitidis]